MSMAKSREILGFSKNILRNGTHFSSLSVKAKTSIATAVNGRKIIKAGTIIAKDGTVAVESGDEGAKTSNAYGIVYEDVDCTNEQTDHIFIPVIVHGIVEEARILGVTDVHKAALKGIIFEAGPAKKADDFSSLEE